MRFCTKCGSPVSGMLRYCTRCGMEIGAAPERYTTTGSSNTGAEMAGAGAAGAGAAGAGAAGTETVQPAAAPQDSGNPAASAAATGHPAPGSPPPKAPEASAHAGSPPVIPAQAGAADGESRRGAADGESRGGLADDEPGSVPASHPAPAEAARPVDSVTAQADHEEPAADEPAADRPPAEHGDNVAQPETAPATSMSEDDGLLRLVRIGADADDEPWSVDPWLPGSRRPDRRALVIGGVIIAGLLAVASTAWLVGTNPPPAGGAHGTHASRPSQLGSSGHAQPSQALSGHPAPGLTRTSPPVPIQTSTGPAHSGQSGPGQSGPGQSGHGQSGHGQTGHGQTGTGPGAGGHQGTTPSGAGHSSTSHPGTSQRGTHRAGSGPAGSSGAGSGQGSSGQGSSGQSGPGQARSAPSRTGQSGASHGTTPQAPHPRRPAPVSGGGSTAGRSAHGIVSVTSSLAGRADARRAAALLDRYFAAVNHRRYSAYAGLFAQRRQLTPREFAWGYRTSHDSKAVLVGVSALKGGLKATVTFTSHQDPAESPDHSSCIDWKITLFLRRNGPAYLIGMPPTGYRAGLHACGFVPRHPSSPQRGGKHPASKHRSSKHGRGRIHEQDYQVR